MDYSPPGLSVDRISQARTLERVAISFSGGSYQPKDQTWVSCTAGRFFTIQATGEGPGPLSKCSPMHDPSLFSQKAQVVTRMAIVAPTSEIKNRGAGKLADLPRITREIPEAGIQIPVFFSKINFLTLEYKPFTTVQYYIIKLNENLIHIN